MATLLATPAAFTLADNVLTLTDVPASGAVLAYLNEQGQAVPLLELPAEAAPVRVAFPDLGGDPLGNANLKALFTDKLSLSTPVAQAIASAVSIAGGLTVAQDVALTGTDLDPSVASLYKIGKLLYAVTNGAPAAYDTLQEVAAQLNAFAAEFASDESKLGAMLATLQQHTQQIQANQQAIATNAAGVQQNAQAISTIQGLIPATASPSNQLATKADAPKVYATYSTTPSAAATPTTPAQYAQPTDGYLTVAGALAVAGRVALVQSATTGFTVSYPSHSAAIAAANVPGNWIVKLSGAANVLTIANSAQYLLYGLQCLQLNVGSFTTAPNGVSPTLYGLWWNGPLVLTSAPNGPSQPRFVSCVGGPKAYFIQRCYKNRQSYPDGTVGDDTAYLEGTRVHNTSPYFPPNTAPTSEDVAGGGSGCIRFPINQNYNDQVNGYGPSGQGFSFVLIDSKFTSDSGAPISGSIPAPDGKTAVHLQGSTSLVGAKGAADLLNNATGIAPTTAELAKMLPDERPAGGGGGFTPVTSGDGTKYLSDKGTYATPAGAGSSGIDYANPITLSAAATLQANKAYYVTGSGYTLTLPSAAQNAGAGIFIQIAPDATGLFPIANGDGLSLYAAETMLYRGIGSAFVRASPGLRPMVARLETTTSQQDSFGPNGIQLLPLTTRTSLTGPDGLTSGAAIVVQRSGRMVFNAGGVLNQLSSTTAGYTLILRRTAPDGSVGYPVVVYGVIGVNGDPLAVCQLAATLPVAAGERYELTITPGQASCALAGQYPTNVFFLNATELI